MSVPAAEREAALMRVLAELDRTDAGQVRDGLLAELEAVIYQPPGLPALDVSLLAWLAEVLDLLDR